MNHPAPRYFCVDRLAVEVHHDRIALGRAAACAVASCLRGVIATRGEARVIFACAPSQNEFLDALIEVTARSQPLDWRCVTAFHMDEYVGLPASHPENFRSYLKTHLLERLPIARHHLLAVEASAPSECARYAELLKEKPIDLICLGVGENGHLAFNDPCFADFEDPTTVKTVELDEQCRQQQVNDACFPTLQDVPTHAVTLTLPVFRNAARLSVHVPGPRKAAAVRAALREPVSTACPASILRLHPNATLYLDDASAASV